mgnify:CR=1 FL=1
MKEWQYGFIVMFSTLTVFLFGLYILPLFSVDPFRSLVMLLIGLFIVLLTVELLLKDKVVKSNKKKRKLKVVKKLQDRFLEQ